MLHVARYALREKRGNRLSVLLCIYICIRMRVQGGWGCRCLPGRQGKAPLSLMVVIRSSLDVNRYT
mgnify:CR=1 FL=1